MSVETDHIISLASLPPTPRSRVRGSPHHDTIILALPLRQPVNARATPAVRSAQDNHDTTEGLEAFGSMASCTTMVDQISEADAVLQVPPGTIEKKRREDDACVNQGGI